MALDSTVWRRFDRVVAIGCEKYADRIEKLSVELERVGLLPYVKYSIDYSNPFLEKLNESLRFTCIDTKRYFRCGYNHYSSILSAYKEGCTSILLLEDDIVFLKDLQRLFEAISILPRDFDLAMLDKNICRQSRMEDYVNPEGWLPIIGRFNSTGCYALSRLGMERYMRAYEKGRDGRLTNNDLLLTESDLGADVRRYASFPNLAVQRTDRNSMCASMASYILNQRRWGVDMDAYNMTIDDLAKELASNAVKGDTINSLLDRIIREKISLRPQKRTSNGYNLRRRRVVDGPLTASRRAEWNW